jgi:hypothetical protein
MVPGALRNRERPARVREPSWASASTGTGRRNRDLLARGWAIPDVRNRSKHVLTSYPAPPSPCRQTGCFPGTGPTTVAEALRRSAERFWALGGGAYRAAARNRAGLDGARRRKDVVEDVAGSIPATFRPIRKARKPDCVFRARIGFVAFRSSFAAATRASSRVCGTNFGCSMRVVSVASTVNCVPGPLLHCAMPRGKLPRLTLRPGPPHVRQHLQ